MENNVFFLCLYGCNEQHDLAILSQAWFSSALILQTRVVPFKILVD